MTVIHEITLLAAALGSGLVAGLCFAFAAFIMRALDGLGAPRAIRAMQAINTTILRSAAMPVWLGTALAGVLAAAFAWPTDSRALVIAAAVLYVIGALLITGRGNVPLNEQLDRVDPEGPGADEAWRRYRVAWGRWNVLRTAACTVACAGFALAL